MEEELSALSRIEDRLESTNDASYAATVKKLLPKLIPLVVNDVLRAKVIQILTLSLKRIKLLRCILSLTDLLQLVSPTADKNDVFKTNFALVFVDSALDYLIQAVDHGPNTTCDQVYTEIVCDINDGVSIILNTLANHAVFSHPSNSLCHYTLQLFRHIANAKNTLPMSASKHLIGDLIVDICLLQVAVAKNSTGSVQAGLSNDRILRLTCKKDIITLDEIVRLKRLVLETLNNNWFPSCYSVAIAMILSNDLNSNLAEEAAYRRNGSKELYHVANDAIEVIFYLLNLCNISVVDSQNPRPLCTHSYRTPIRKEIRCSIMHWIRKDALDFVTTPSLLFEMINKMLPHINHADTDVRYQGYLYSLLDKLVEKVLSHTGVVVEEHLEKLQSIFITVKTSLKSITNYVLEGSTSDHAAVREHCYSLVDKIAQKYNAIAAFDTEIINIFFGLLDFEKDILATKLFTALHSLRLWFDLNRALTNQALYDTLRRNRASPIDRVRLLSLQWILALYTWRDGTLYDTLVLLTHDTYDLVRQKVKNQYKLLEEYLLVKPDPAHSAEYSHVMVTALSYICHLEPHNKFEVNTVSELLKCLSVGLRTILDMQYSYSSDNLAFLVADNWPTLIHKDAIGTFPDIEDIVLNTLQRMQAFNYDPLIADGDSKIVECVVGFIRDSVLVLNTSSTTTKSQVGSMKHYYVTLLLQFAGVAKGHEARYQLGQAMAIFSTLDRDESYINNLVLRILKAKVKTVVEHSTSNSQVAGETTTGQAALVAITSIIECIAYDDKLRESLLRDIFPLFSAVITAIPAKSNIYVEELGTAAISCVGIFASRLCLQCLNSDLVLSTLKALVTYGNNKNVRIASIDALTRCCFQRVATSITSLEQEVWDLLWTVYFPPLTTFVPLASISDVFGCAEGLVRLCIQPGGALDVSRFNLIVAHCNDFIRGICSADSEVTANRVHVELVYRNIAVIFTVLLKHVGRDIPSGTLVLWTELMLHIMKVADSFTQDICCTGFVYLYNTGCTNDAAMTSNGKSIATIIATEIINALSREKKGLQPAGYAVAGEHTTTSREGDFARAVERVANNTGATVAGNGGTTGANPDALLLAAQRAAAELGISPNQGTNPTSSDSRDKGDYGVYTIACKVAKSTGDPSVVFTVLTLIKRDIEYGVPGSDTEVYYNRYKPASPTISNENISKILPSLYLAKFNPITSIREVMKSVYKTIVTDSNRAMLQTLHKSIINTLSLSLVSMSWKYRQAACHALDDYLHHPFFNWMVLKPYAEVLFVNGLRVLDDIRDSVRATALGFMKTLADHLIRACDCSKGADLIVEPIDVTVASILPILIDKGILSTSAEGKGFSFGVLREIIKSAQSSLKGWLPRLISVTTEGMSALEPKTLQYMSFHTVRLDISDKELENLRLSLAQKSPLQESLDLCLHALTVDLIPLTISYLCEHLTIGVGLPTRVAAINSLCYLVELYPSHLKALSDKPYRSIISSLLLASSRIAGSLKDALLKGVVVLGKVVCMETITSAVRQLVASYYLLGRDDDNQSVFIASIIAQIITRNGERIDDVGVWTDLLSIVYVGMFDDDAESKRIFTDIWSVTLSYSGAGNKISAVNRLYQSLFSDQVVNLLTDNSWKRKHQGVLIVKDIVPLLSVSRLYYCVGYITELFLVLLKRQRWSGQDDVCEALICIVNKFITSEASSSDPDTDQWYLQAVDYGDSVDTIIQTGLVDNKSNQNTHVAFTRSVALQDLTSAASQSVPALQAATVYWKLSMKGLIQLLLDESNRYEDTYQFNVAKSLALLPWKVLGQRIPSLLSDHIQTLLHLAGVRFDTQPPSEINVKVPVQAPSISSSSSRHAASIQSMFGNRYGNLPTPAKSQKLSHTTVTDVRPALPEETSVEKQKTAAFRLKFLEIMVACWDSDKVATDTREKLLHWVQTALLTEVWSIKKALYELQTELVLRETDLAKIRVTINTISTGINDKKYTKIRVTALNSLSRLLACNLEVYRNNFDREIKDMLSSLNAEQDSEMLQAVAGAKRVYIL
jgi:hypothetical protein